MQVLLVVFDRKAFELSGKVYSDIRSYVDENYVDTSHEREYSRHNRYARIREELEQDRLYHSLKEPESYHEYENPDSTGTTYSTVYDDFVSDESRKSLNEFVEKPADNFRDRLFELIDKSGMDDPAVYKNANISKKVFSDIKNRPDYKPSKKTALSFAIALNLTLEETQDLLARAGLTLSPSSRFDLVVAYCISHGVYDFYTINNALFDNDQECIRTME